MKRIVILIVLVAVAAVAGVVRSSVGSVSELRGLVSHKNTADVRQEIRQTYELAPGARVEISGLNGAVKIETSDTKTAEIYIERTASSQEALDHRKITIEADANSLRISGGKSEDAGFFSRFFDGSAGDLRLCRTRRETGHGNVKGRRPKPTPLP